MAISDSSVGVNVSSLSLGGGYATDAAAEAAWTTKAARTQGSAVYQADGTTLNITAGTQYYNTTSLSHRIHNGTSWDTYVAGGPGANTLDTSYNNGRTITADSGALQFNKTDATGAIRVDLDAANGGFALDINVDAASTANLIDIVTTAAFTADAISVDLTASAVGSQVLVVPNSGVAHTAEGFIIDATNDQAGSGDWINLQSTGADTGVLLALGRSTAAATGAFIECVSDATAVGSVFLDIDVVGVQTANVIEIDFTTTGSANAIEVAAASTWTGSCFTWNNTNCVGAQMLEIPTTASIMTATGWVLDAANSGASSGAWVNLLSTGIDTGELLNLNRTTANATGAFIQCNSDASALGSVFIDLNVVGVQTANVIEIDFTTTGSANALEVAAASTWTGSVVAWNNTNCVGAQFLEVPTTASIMTATGWVLDVANSGASSGSWVNLLSTGVDTGVFLDLNRTTANATGAFIQCTTDASALGSVFLDFDVVGVQTANLIEVDFTTTGSANVLEVAAASTWTGDVISFTPTNCVGAQLIVMPTTAGIMTAAGWVMNIANSGATDADWVDLTATGAGSGNLVDLNWTTGAGTGDAIGVTTDATAVAVRHLDLNCDGIQTVNIIDIDATAASTASAIAINTAGVGASGVASALTVTQTGNTAAGADVVRVFNSGTMSSTSHLLSLENSTASGGATSYNLYISADAANVEAIHVDAGTVLIDETLAVTGGFTTAPIFAATTQLIADPGNAGAIPVTADGVCTLTTAGAETRTVADPAYIGQNLTIIFDVDAGNVVTTFASNVVDTDGGDHNTLTWDDATDGIVLKAGYVGGSLAWFAVQHLGAAVNANFTSV